MLGVCIEDELATFIIVPTLGKLSRLDEMTKGGGFVVSDLS